MLAILPATARRFPTAPRLCARELDRIGVDVSAVGQGHGGVHLARMRGDPAVG